MNNVHPTTRNTPVRSAYSTLIATKFITRYLIDEKCRLTGILLLVFLLKQSGLALTTGSAFLHKHAVRLTTGTLVINLAADNVVCSFIGSMVILSFIVVYLGINLSTSGVRFIDPLVVTDSL